MRAALDKPLFDLKTTHEDQKEPAFKTINVVAEGDEDKHGEDQVLYESKEDALADP